MPIRDMYVNTSKPCNLLRVDRENVNYNNLNLTVGPKSDGPDAETVLQENDLDQEGDISENVTAPDRSGEIEITMRILERPDVSLSSPITPYDACIMDAVYSLLRAGYRIFSPEMVLNVMDGYSGTNISKQRIDRVVESIERLSVIRVELDCYNEFTARGIKYKKAILRSYLLPVDSATLKAKNHAEDITAFKLPEKPALYEYAERVHQIGSYPVRLLADKPLTITDGTEKPKSVQKSEPRTRRSLVDEDTVLRQCIMRRILAMKNENNHYSTAKIAYVYWKDGIRKGLFAEVGVDLDQYSNPRKKRAQLHHKVTTFLDSLTAQSFISGYDTYKKTVRRNKESQSPALRFF